MSCRGELKRVAREGQKWLVLTAKGEAVARQKVPGRAEPAGREWDGGWRWLFLDWRGVAPRWRFLLARRLTAAGFGRWRSTLWVSPFPLETEIKSLLAEEALRGKVVVWEAKRTFGLAEGEVAAQAWPLHKLNQAYAALVREWEEGQRNYGQSVEVIKKLAASLQERYLTLLCADPGLPVVLLPSDWWGGRVKKLLPEWTRAVY
jgi:DNA-binding transcriptional regulator PaaX